MKNEKNLQFNKKDLTGFTPLNSIYTGQAKNKIAIIIAILIVLGLGVLGANKVEAADYYVSPTGNASWGECTNINAPCSAETSMQNAQAGDVVYFLGGVYELGECPDVYEHAKLEPQHSGSFGNSITFIANSGDTPVMECTCPGDCNPPRTRVLGNNFNDYITWDGFTVQANNGTKPAGIVIWGAHSDYADGCEVRNCNINGGSEITTFTSNVEGIRIERTNNTLIKNCRIFDFEETNNNGNMGGIKTYGNENLIIENNEFINCTGGVFLKSNTNNANVRYNLIEDSYYGIRVNMFNSTENVSINNNLFLDSRHFGIFMEDDNEGTTANNYQIFSNTFYDTSYRDIILAPGSSYEVYNNIIDSSSQDKITTRTDASLAECDHNQFGTSLFNIRISMYDGQRTYNSLSSWKSSGELEGERDPGEGSLTSSPLFVNNSGTMSFIDDFTLDINSPCVSAGRNDLDMGANIDLVGIQGATSSVVRADVDQDEEINTTDASLTLRNSLGLSMTGTDWQSSAITGDVNCDGNSNSIDAMLILRYSLGLDMDETEWCE